MLDQVLVRIESRLRAVGLSATAASKRAGLSEDAIRNIRRSVESGSRKGISTQTLSALAPVLQTTEGWLLTGDGDDGPRRSAVVAIAGRVGAGAEIEAIADETPRYIEIPYDWQDAVPFEVAGTSCYPIYEPGDIIIVRGEPRLILEEIEGHMCVVETEAGLGLVKRVFEDGRGTFQLESPNAPPRKQVALRSARRVVLKLDPTQVG